MECKSFTMKEQSKPLFLACSTMQCYTTIVGLKGCERNAQRILYAIVREEK
jgi:hypothetical protein